MALGKTIIGCAVSLVLVIVSLASFQSNALRNTATTSESDKQKVLRYRLPNNTIPRLYNIYIEPNMNDEIFSWNGKISIDIQVVNPTLVLTLHAYKNLIIRENYTELVNTNGTKLAPVKHYRDEVAELLKLHFDHVIPVGNYSLRLKYDGKDTLDSVGFYKASYSFEVMEREYNQVVGTHFEATTARRAFPCWDEPGLKARFKVSIKHFSNYTAMSNMPELEHSNTSDDKILTVFHTTPIMPTYLVTFVISNYENVINHHGNVSVHAPASVMDDVRHLMDFSAKVVKVMEAYTGFSHGVPRLGSVTLPKYTSAATEHWGLVAYREIWIRRKENETKIDENDRIDMLIAHELSHSWFGNRVTPRWWDDLWLNEGFAAYFQFYIVDQIYDNWRGLELFIVMNNQEMAFPMDGDLGSPAIPVKWTPITNREIRNLFSRLTYKKGAAIVHMYRRILGDNVFRAGIQKYFAKHSFQSVDADDLMAAFQEAYEAEPISGKYLNIKETMTPWLTQMGYPMINVTRDYTTGDTEVSQISTLIEHPSNKWWIPLNYATRSSLDFSSTLPISWISDNQDSVKVSGIDKNDWVVWNIQASGYYRVNYDKENWNRLARYLNTDDYKNIHVLNRARLINDAHYLAQRQPNEYLPIFYKITKYLAREVEYLPWRTAYSAFFDIDRELRGTGLYSVFVKQVLGLMHSFVLKIGFEAKDTDDHFTKLARLDVIPWACELGHIECSKYATQKLMKRQKHPSENRSYREDNVMFCAGLRGMNHTTIQPLLNWANKEDERLFIANVGCTENHELHINLLNAALKKNSTEDKDIVHRVFGALLHSTDENFNFAVDFFLENHQAMNNTAAFLGSDRTSDSEINCNDATGNQVFQIFCAVTSRPRLEKMAQVLLLDAVIRNPNIPKKIIEQAERKIAETEVRIAPYLKLYDELSAENSMNGPQINFR